MTKNILITGANGQVGYELMRSTLFPAGWVRIGLDRNDFDLTDIEKMPACFDKYQPDLVINAAAYTAVDKAEEEKDLAFAVNATAPEAMAQYCQARGIPLLHISTDYVFNGRKKTPYIETDKTASLGVYGDSKLDGEKRIRKVMRRYIILRTAWVYGRHGNNFVKTMLRLGAERDELSVVGDQFGAPTAAKDIAEAIAKISVDILGENRKWGTYHFCGTGKASWYDFAAEIFKQKGLKLALKKITTAEYPTPAQRPINSAFNCNKIKEYYGIKAPKWQESLKAVLTEV
ncbi:MAG: dTDP-4-dehydrorhamnose reductase [Alphaproteobacteria bacterium]